MNAAMQVSGAPPVFDYSATLARVEGDVELVREMAAIFLDTHGESVRQIEKGLDAGNAVEVHRAAHALKGSAANFDAEQVVTAAYQLETLGRSKNLTEAPALLSQLRSALDSLVRALRPLADARAR